MRNEEGFLHGSPYQHTVEGTPLGSSLVLHADEKQGV